MNKPILILNVLIVVALFAAIIALGALVITTVQMVPLISVGQVNTSVTGMSGTIKIPVSLTDRGPLPMNGISVVVSVYDSSGNALFHGGGGPVSISSGSSAQLPVSISFDLNKLPNSTIEQLATTNQDLKVKASLVGTVSPLAGLNGTVYATLPWGAPLENFNTGTPTITPINSSFVSVSVPVSFTNNNSYISVTGIAQVTILDQLGNKVGSGSINIDASPGMHFQSIGKLIFALPKNLQGLLFNDSTLRYAVDVNFESNGASLFSTSQSVILGWKAPLSNLSIGRPSIKPYNSTFLQATTPISFDNRNDYVDISTNFNLQIMNGSTILGYGNFPVNAPHGINFTGNMVTYIALAKLPMNVLLFNNSVLDLNTVLTGVYSGASIGFTQNVSLPWEAPMYNLSFGSLSASPYNATYAEFSLPLNFTDGSRYLPLNASIDGVVLSSSQNQIGVVTNLAMNVSVQSYYSGMLTGYIETSGLSQHSFTMQLLIHTNFGTFEKDVVVNG